MPDFLLFLAFSILCRIFLLLNFTLLLFSSAFFCSQYDITFICYLKKKMTNTSNERHSNPLNNKSSFFFIAVKRFFLKKIFFDMMNFFEISTIYFEIIMRIHFCVTMTFTPFLAGSEVYILISKVRKIFLFFWLDER